MSLNISKPICIEVRLQIDSLKEITLINAGQFFLCQMPQSEVIDRSFIFPQVKMLFGITQANYGYKPVISSGKNIDTY
jgi:hypothetical protein